MGGSQPCGFRLHSLAGQFAVLSAPLCVCPAGGLPRWGSAPLGVCPMSQQAQAQVCFTSWCYMCMCITLRCVPLAPARKQEIITVTEQLMEAINSGDFKAYS